MKSKILTAVLSLLMVAFVATGCKSSTSATGNDNTTAATQATGTSTATGAASSTGAGAGCPTSNTTSFAKTKFVLHSGLAFGAFHRYIYKPYQAGTFKSGAHGRILSLVKAATAALYIKREVRLAYDDTTANPTLCKAIAAPLQAVGNDISGAVSKLKGGDSSGVTAIQNTVASTETSSAATGNTIQENANAPLS